MRIQNAVTAYLRSYYLLVATQSSASSTGIYWNTS